jgi:transposase
MEKLQVRKQYTIEFKKASIKLIDEENLTFSEAGIQMNTSPKNIRRWHKLYNKSPSEQKLKEEIKRLQKNVRQIKDERDVLLKSVLFFARNFKENSI